MGFRVEGLGLRFQAERSRVCGVRFLGLGCEF